MVQPLKRTCSLACLAVALGGCAGTNLLSWNRIKTADEQNPAVEIIGMWQAAEGHDPRGIPARGFAGQILFFARGSKAPVVVEGDVRIYVFDDEGPADARGRPLHQFDFLGDSWTRHLHKGPLGPSYHVFVPYTKRDHHEAHCSLRVRLTPKHGPVLYSDTVTVTLPGPTRDEQRQTHPAVPAMSNAGLFDAATASGSGRSREAAPREAVSAAHGAGLPRSESVRIQQLAATNPAAAADPAEARLHRLELMMEQLLQRETVPPPAAVRPAELDPAERPADEEADELRFRLRPADRGRGADLPAAANQDRSADGEHPLRSGESLPDEAFRHPLTEESTHVDSRRELSHPLQ